MKETQETLDKLKELTKDVQVDPEEYEKLYNQIMNEVYTDPEYQKIYEEFNELTAQANQLKDMIGEKNLDDIAERKKVQDMFDL